MSHGQLIALGGLALDFVGATIIVAADLPRVRVKILQLIHKIPRYQSKYYRIYRGFEKARSGGLDPSEDELVLVLQYLLEYVGTIPENSDLLRQRTDSEFIHRMRRFTTDRMKVEEMSDHPLFYEIAEADEVKIHLSDTGDCLVLECDGDRAEYSRWHDTERLDDELYNLFLRSGFTFLLIGFFIQLIGYTIAFL